MIERQRLNISPSGQICISETEFHKAFLNDKKEIELVLVTIRKHSTNHRGNKNSVLSGQKPYDLNDYKNYTGIKDDRVIFDKFGINERIAS